MNDPRAIKEIEAISEGFRKLRERIDAMKSKARTQEQLEAIESLSRGLGGVRGCELGIARQSLGLDQHMMGLNAAFKKSRKY